MNLKKKFSTFTEMVTNARENKISASGVIGVLFCIFGLILFITSTICFYCSVGDATFIMSLIDKILILIGSGTCLLGVRKVGSMVNNKNNGGDNNTEVNQ